MLSANVAALTEGVIKTMLLSKLKVMTALVLLTTAALVPGWRDALLGPIQAPRGLGDFIQVPDLARWWSQGVLKMDFAGLGQLLVT